MISFESKNKKMPILDFARVEIWLQDVAAIYDKKIGNLNYLLVDDEEILRINRKFLNHDFFTDIITFDYSHGERISGDIFISIDTVQSNAEIFHSSFSNELLRVVVHGLLHLCGIDDKGPGEREIMEQNENEALKIWENLSPEF